MHFFHVVPGGSIESGVADGVSKAGRVLVIEFRILRRQRSIAHAGRGAGTHLKEAAELDLGHGRGAYRA